jgi:OOP family OmpA-OmpF porin
MNKLSLKTLMTVIASSALTASIAVAHEGGQPNESYVGDSKGHYILDSAGRCVRTSAWTEETATKECNPELFPEPVAEAPPPPVVVYEQVTLSAIALFDFDSAVLHSGGKAALHELDEDIKAKGAIVVDIDVVGHTDSIGTEEYNQGLSERRAMSVRDYMVSEGIDSSIIDVSGMGESQPVATNDTKEGRAENRRVQISIGAEEQAN